MKNLSILPAFFLLYFTMTEQPAVPLAATLGALHAGLMFCVRRSRPHVHDIMPLAIILVAGAACFTNPWLQVAWLALLTGVAIGRTVDRPSFMEVLATIFQLSLLLSLLFFFVLPYCLQHAKLEMHADLLIIVQALLALWAVLQLIVSFTSNTYRVEPVVSSLSAMLCMVLAMAAGISYYMRPQDDYLLQVLYVLGGGGLLALVAWLVWNPYFGEGLANRFFRHIMALTLPLDDWLEKLAALADQQGDATAFWHAAMQQLVEETQLTGVFWEEDTREFIVGEQGRYSSQLSLADLNLTLHSQQRLLPTVMLNLWLLARLALEYRQSKEREARLASEARMRSIYELGARTTHDLKNLLQAITLLCSRQKDDDKQLFTDFKRGQMLQLASRLETTLARLKGESMDAIDGGMMSALNWWDGAMQRNRHRVVTFKSPIRKTHFEVPADLYDRALENLVHNSLRKQGRDGELTIEVDFSAGPVLTVRDNGSAIPEELVGQLFNAPLPSSEGMGIGLFQLHQNAMKKKYRLSISSNIPGNVAITLEPA